MSDTNPYESLKIKPAFVAEPATNIALNPANSPEKTVSQRGLTEDWTAGVVGLIVVVSSLLLCLGTKPSDFHWSTRLVKTAAASDLTLPSPVAAKTVTEYSTVTEKPKWNASLKGWIGKVAGWEQSPLDAFNDAKSKKSIVPGLLGALVATALIGILAVLFQRLPIGPFLAAFPVVFLLAVLAFVMAKQAVIEMYNLEYALWALLVGMIICNTVGTPHWLKPAVRGELFIKIGLVLLGAEVLFGRLLALGIPGICVSWVVTPVVLIGTYIFGQRVLKMESKSLNIVISADMSVCGVSAAIATAAAPHRPRPRRSRSCPWPRTRSLRTRMRSTARR